MGNKGYINYINSDAWQEKRIQRLKLDNYTCQECGSTKELEVHHKNYDNFTDEDVENDLITLCYNCHYKKHMSWLANVCPSLKSKSHRDPRDRYQIYCQYLFFKSAMVNEFGKIKITKFNPEPLFNAEIIFRPEMEFEDDKYRYSVIFNYIYFKINGINTALFVGFLQSCPINCNCDKNIGTCEDDGTLILKTIYINPFNAKTNNYSSFFDEASRWEYEFEEKHGRPCRLFKDAIMSYEQLNRQGYINKVNFKVEK